MSEAREKKKDEIEGAGEGAEECKQIANVDSKE